MKIVNVNTPTKKLYERYKEWSCQNYPDEKLESNRYFLQNAKLNYTINDHIVSNGYDSTGIKNLKFKNS